MAGVFSIISNFSFVLAIIFLLVSVYLWFKFNIPLVYGEFSGKTAKKSIEKLRERNEKSGKKTFSPSVVNYERGKITEKVAGLYEDSSIFDMQAVKKTENMETGVLLEGDNFEPVAEKTAVLIDESTVALETEDNKGKLGHADDNRQRVAMKIIDEVVCIHTDEKV